MLFTARKPATAAEAAALAAKYTSATDDAAAAGASRGLVCTPCTN